MFNRRLLSLTTVIGFGLLSTACAGPSATALSVLGKPAAVLDSGVDSAGGPRVKLIVLFDEKGNLIAQATASGHGTAQGVAEGLLPAAATATGIGIAANALRPAISNITAVNSAYNGGNKAVANGPGSSRTTTVAYGGTGLGIGGQGGAGYGGTGVGIGGSGGTGYGGTAITVGN